MPRLYHAAVSFAIVLTAYWVYSLAAVPLIEPTITGPARASERMQLSETDSSQRLSQLEGLFPPGSIDLKKMKILENDKVVFVLDSYTNRGDGQVELHPCIMVFLWDGPAEDEEERKRRSVILEAPKGALLKFDKPMELTHIGHLVGGTLLGPITVHSQGKSPGPEDDLLITTNNDVQLNNQEIWTPYPIQFTWGKNSGSGKDMHVKLLAGQAKSGSDFAAPNIAGIETFEIRKIDRIHLESPPKDATANNTANSTVPNQINPFSTTGQFDDLPIEITCRGAFTFNVVKRVATFTDHVDVLRLNPNGPADQIQSEKLSLFFVPRESSGNGSDTSTDLEPERIEASGHPVVINAPSQNLTGRGERLAYNIKSKLLSLDGGPEVFLCQGANEIHALRLQYQSLGPDRLGRAVAQGPGWLRMQMGDKPNQILEAQWQDKLRLEPQDKNHLISFTGGASLDYADIGHMKAKEIFFWLKPALQGNPANQPLPDRMLARDQVLLNSSQLDAAVEQLEVWFETKDSPKAARGQMQNNGETIKGQGGINVFPAGRRQNELQRTAYRPPITTPAPGPNSYAVANQQFQSGRQSSQGPTGQMSSPVRTTEAPRYPKYLPQPVPVSPSNFKQSAGAQENRPVPNPIVSIPGQTAQHFKVSGRILRALVQMQDEQNASLKEITIEERVRLEETITASPKEQPLLIQGDRLRGIDVSSPNAVVTVWGRPAHFEGRGIGLTGSNISINRGTSHLKIDGSGRMDLQLPNNTPSLSLIPGKPMTTIGSMFVEWKKGMDFDGRKAKFEQSVSATTAQQHLQTETMEVVLKTPFDFSNPNMQNQTQPEVEELLCHSGVLIENRSTDDQHNLTSYDRMSIGDLAVNLQSGAISALGPGSLNSVSLGANLPNQNTPGMGLLGPQIAGSAAANNNPVNPAQATNQLYCLHVDFQGSITGNIRDSELTFNDQIRAAYAPVFDFNATIDPTRLENLGPQGITLNCNTLKVNQMPLPTGKGNSFELEARGNAVVESGSGIYTARAPRISYNDFKDLLIMEGDGRTDAELFRQLKPGAPIEKTTTRRIEYHPRTNQAGKAELRSIEINQGR